MNKTFLTKIYGLKKYLKIAQYIMLNIPARIQLALKKRAVTRIFAEIYEKSMWGKSQERGQLFFSGSGSHDTKVTSIYVDNITKFLKSLPRKPNAVDLGCGDFFIGSKIRPFCNSYIACDIVPKLIRYNKGKYKDLDVDFRIIDLITDTLPSGDIVFIRQVLQHLSNEQIKQIIPKLSSSYNILILTEHLPKSNTFTPNLDKSEGHDIRLEINSGIVLTEQPFNFRVLYEELICETEEYGGVIRTTLYKLK
jgi:hypothetical protein